MKISFKNQRLAEKVSAVLSFLINKYIRLLTTSPKGLFSANYKEKDKNKNIYKLFKVTILQIIRISFLPLKFV